MAVTVEPLVATPASVPATAAPAAAPATPANTARTARRDPGPLTFDEAKAEGKQVAWGPNCDTTTGKVAVPSGYAPPCVAPWKGGDNGGATAPGVTKTTITVALYQAQPDLLQQAFFKNTGSDESLATERETTQQYVDYFSAHYELYGRTVKLVTVQASGAPDDDVAAKADAIKVATEIHAFASFGGPGQTTAYADELAARGVLCVGDCVIAEPQSFLDSHAPYVWPTTASPVIWWDPTATGPDEVGTVGKGLCRYADDGKRYLPRQWPSAPIPLFDVSTSIGVLTKLPPADQPPSYPSPTASGANR